MITLPVNFQTDITNNESAKLIYARLYYDDETEYIPFCTLTKVIDNKQSIAGVVNFTPSKSTWNWDAKNNITVTTPTLRITNIELPNYRFMDEIYNKNFLGKKAQIYVGHLNHSTTSSDMVLLYSGNIKDIHFNVNDNDINIVLQAQALLNNEVQGRLINYSHSTLGGDTGFFNARSLSNAENSYAPTVYGNNLFSPTVAVQGGMDGTYKD
jgi:hypothetical protein